MVGEMGTLDYVLTLILGFAIFSMFFGLIILYTTLKPKKLLNQPKVKKETTLVSTEQVSKRSIEEAENLERTGQYETAAMKYEELEEMEKVPKPEHLKSVAYCRSCGKENDTDAVFCDNCGANIFEASTTLTKVYCNTCGTKNSKIAKYCKKCGKKLP
jgi:ribosomal protein L37E